MYRTLEIKLYKSNELTQTAKLWNADCQDVIDYGFAAHDHNKTRLTKLHTRTSEANILHCLLCYIKLLGIKPVICSRDFDLKRNRSSILLVQSDLTLEP